jgi:hypothetical protein
MTADAVRVAAVERGHTPRRVFADALGISDKTAKRMDLPGKRVGRNYIVDVPAALTKIFGDTTQK